MSKDDNMSVDETRWEDVAPDIRQKNISDGLDKFHIWEEIEPDTDIEQKGVLWELTDKNKEIIGTYICKYDSFSMYHKYVYVIKDLNNEKRYIFGFPEIDKLFGRVKENDVVKIVFIGRTHGVHGIAVKLFKRRE